VLRTDETITAHDRARLLALIKQGPEPQATNSERCPPSARIVRRSEGAARLGISLRTYDKLTRQLGMKRKWPGRMRAAGVTEEDLNALIAGRRQ